MDYCMYNLLSHVLYVLFFSNKYSRLNTINFVILHSLAILSHHCASVWNSLVFKFEFMSVYNFVLVSKTLTNFHYNSTVITTCVLRGSCHEYR